MSHIQNEVVYLLTRIQCIAFPLTISPLSPIHGLPKHYTELEKTTLQDWFYYHLMERKYIFLPGEYVKRYLSRWVITMEREKRAVITSINCRMWVRLAILLSRCSKIPLEARSPFFPPSFLIMQLSFLSTLSFNYSVYYIVAHIHIKIILYA